MGRCKVQTSETFDRFVTSTSADGIIVGDWNHLTDRQSIHEYVLRYAVKTTSSFPTKFDIAAYIASHLFFFNFARSIAVSISSQRSSMLTAGFCGV